MFSTFAYRGGDNFPLRPLGARLQLLKVRGGPAGVIRKQGLCSALINNVLTGFVGADDGTAEVTPPRAERRWRCLPTSASW